MVHTELEGAVARATREAAAADRRAGYDYTEMIADQLASEFAGRLWHDALAYGIGGRVAEAIGSWAGSCTDPAEIVRVMDGNWRLYLPVWALAYLAACAPVSCGAV